MIIATRRLVLRADGRQIEVPIEIHAPEGADIDWICRFTIGWPDDRQEKYSTGIDAIQALLFALQMIGAEVNASKYRESGKLDWLVAGRGYGFPVPGNIRDILSGDDARFL